MNHIKYMIIGAGGTGGALGFYLTVAGKDVTLIARGAHLDAIRENGLFLETGHGGFSVPAEACTMEEYRARVEKDAGECPDIIFVCVKGYSLDETVPFIRQTAGPNTIVIPLLNIYGTGKRLQALLPELTVTDGCIYIASEIKQPGCLLMSGDIFRVVFGLRKDTDSRTRTVSMPVLKLVEADLSDAGILPILSDQVERDTLRKFSFVSPMAAVGASYDVSASAMQPDGPLRQTFISLVEEVKALSDAMEIPLPEDIVSINLKIMDDLAPTATASMQRDIKKGHQSEVDGLVYEVVRLGNQYQVPMPVYGELADKLGF